MRTNAEIEQTLIRSIAFLEQQTRIGMLTVVSRDILERLRTETTPSSARTVRALDPATRPIPWRLQNWYRGELTAVDGQLDLTPREETDRTLEEVWPILTKRIIPKKLRDKAQKVYRKQAFVTITSMAARTLTLGGGALLNGQETYGVATLMRDDLRETLLQTADDAVRKPIENTIPLSELVTIAVYRIELKHAENRITELRDQQKYWPISVYSNNDLPAEICLMKDRADILRGLLRDETPARDYLVTHVEELILRERAKEGTGYTNTAA